MDSAVQRTGNARPIAHGTTRRVAARATSPAASPSPPLLGGSPLIDTSEARGAFEVGELAPVASNDAADGRARNLLRWIDVASQELTVTWLYRAR